MGGGDTHFQVTLKGANLVPVTRGFFGGSRTNPMFKLSAFQMGQAEPFYVVYESETVENNLNPVWKKSSTSESLFGDPELPVMISVFDKQPNSETPIGTIETSLSEIKRKAVGDTDQVDASKIFKLKDANGKESGLIVVVEAKGGVDPDEEPPEPEPEPEPESDESQSMAAPQSNASMNSIPSLDSRRASATDTNMLMEFAKLQQALRDLTRKTDKLEKETSDLKKETSDLRHENKELKDRVKYLENSLKQDRKLMEMAQNDIKELKKNGGGGTAALNGSKHAPNPSILDGDLLLSASPSADSMDDKSGKSSRDRKDKDKHSSPSKKGSDHKSTSTLSTVDSNSDDKSKGDKHRSHSRNHDEKKESERSNRHQSPRRGSTTSMASKMSTASRSRRDKDDPSTKSPGGSRSMRRTRSTDGSSATPSRPGSRRPGSSSKSKEMGSRSEKGSSSRSRDR